MAMYATPAEEYRSTGRAIAVHQQMEILAGDVANVRQRVGKVRERVCGSRQPTPTSPTLPEKRTPDSVFEGYESLLESVARLVRDLKEDLAEIEREIF